MGESVLLLAGGGGHTGYAVALAEELKDQVELCFLAPEDDLLSIARLQAYGKVDTLVKPRHPKTSVYKFLPRLAKSFIQSIKRIPENCRCVISTGSNFCIPPALISWLRRIPIINLESADRFVRPSRTARILQPFSEVTALQWEEQKRILKGIVFGPIIPKKIVEPWSGGYILIASGTYGYEELIEAASKTMLENVVLQTGGADSYKYKIKIRHPNWRVVSTSERFYELIAGAEVVVSPPGVTPLEAVAYGKPVVIVRYPGWSKAGTIEDARLFAKKLNAPFLPVLTPEALEESINKAKRSEKLWFKNGARELAHYIMGTIL